MHFADAGDKGRKGSDDRHELGIDDGLTAVLFIESARTVQILAPENPGAGVAEQSIPQSRSQQEAKAVTEDRGECQRRDNRADVQLSRADANRKEQRVPRQEKSDEQAAFREHNQKKGQIDRPHVRTAGNKPAQRVRISQAAIQI